MHPQDQPDPAARPGFPPAAPPAAYVRWDGTAAPAAPAAPAAEPPPAAQPPTPQPATTGGTWTVDWSKQPAAAAPEQPAEEQPKAPRVPWKRIGLAGVVLVLLGVFGAGVGVGWAAGSRSVDGAAGDTTVQVIAAPTDAAGDLVAVPDVRGLVLVDAQQAILDAGLPLDIVSTRDAPSALPAGTVVSQDPVGGTEDAEAVTLFVAVPGTVPDLVGQTADAARTALLDLGARFQQVQVYDPAAREGTVLLVDPPAGSPLTGTVTVTVAGPADSVFLSDLDAVEGSCSTGEYPVNGTDYVNSLSCSTGSTARTTSYLVDRLATSLDAVVGIADTSEPGTAATIAVYGDGRELARVTVGYGQSQPISVPLAGVLRVDLQYIAVGDDDYGNLVLGDARAVGSPEAITQLAGS
ncbi:PASTA domain-containing protein [Blastococcus sp. SYSU D00820]